MNSRTIKNIKEEIKKDKEQTAENPEQMKKYAREKYYMKRKTRIFIYRVRR
jgi:cell division protein FtsB